jgi:hypothetical protein
LPAPGAIGHSRLRTRIVRLLALPAIAPSHRSTRSARFSPAIIVALALSTAAFTGIEVVAVAAAAENWLPASRLGAVTVTLPAAAVSARDESRAQTVGAHNTEAPAANVDRAQAVVGSTESIGRAEARPASEPATSAILAAPGAENRGSHEPPATASAPADDSRPNQTSAAGSPVAPLSAENDVTLWGAAASAGTAVGEESRKSGVAIGQGSHKGAVATAGFFTRVGKKIAGSF